MHRWWWSTISWSTGTTNVISWYNTIFNIWSLFIIWTQFRHPHPQQNMFINIICKWSELVMAKNVYLGFSSHGFTYWWIFYFCSAHCKHVPRSTLTHSTNEDLLNIKRKGDAKSRTILPYKMSSPIYLGPTKSRHYFDALIKNNSKNKTYHTDQTILKTKHSTLTKQF